MEADLTEAVIAKASDEHGIVRIGVLALGVLAEAELARRIWAEKAGRPKTSGKSREETPKEGRQTRKGTACDIERRNSSE